MDRFVIRGGSPATKAGSDKSGCKLTGLQKRHGLLS